MADAIQSKEALQRDKLGPESQQRIRTNEKSGENEFNQSFDWSKISFLGNTNPRRADPNPKDYLKLVVNRKKYALATLKTLEDEQLDIRTQIKKANARSNAPKEKSQFSSEDRRKIKELKHRSQLLEQKRDQRLQSIEENDKSRQRRQMERKANDLNALKKARHSEANEHILLIKKRQKDRESATKDSKERQRELRSRSYFFNRQPKLNSPREAVARQDSPQRRLNISDIIMHEKNYQESCQKQGKSRKAKMLELNKKFHSGSQKKYPQNIMSTILKSEQEVQRKKLQYKSSFPQRYSNRVSEYGKMIREQYQPRFRQKTEPSESKHSTAFKNPKQFKSALELKKLGEDYLDFCKKKATKKAAKPHDLKGNASVTTRLVYKDYLKEVRTVTNPNSFQMRFDTVMRESPSPEKIQKLKWMLQDQERLNPDPTEDKLQELIQAKLNIISCVL